MRDISARPKRAEIDAREVDPHLISNDLAPDREKRLYIRYEGSTHTYLIVAYNGHSVPVVEDGGPSSLGPFGLLPRNRMRENACGIHRTGIRAMGRIDIHLVHLEIDDQQEKYLRPPCARKSQIIAIDGAMAKTAWANFPHLENGVATARGVNGVLHPLCVTSLWSNGRRGREHLDLPAARATPPKPEPIADIPGHGPPRRKDNSATASMPSAINSADHFPHTPVSPDACTLRARANPRRGLQPPHMPIAPELSSSSATQKASVPRKSISPTPSQLGLPEIDRPPSWGLGADTTRAPKYPNRIENPQSYAPTGTVLNAIRIPRRVPTTAPIPRVRTTIGSRRIHARRCADPCRRLLRRHPSSPYY